MRNYFHDFSYLLKDFPEFNHLNFISKQSSLLQYNSWQKTIYNNLQVTDCTWNGPREDLNNFTDVLSYELKHGLKSPFWFLILRNNDQYKKVVYDSILDGEKIWSHYYWHPEVNQEDYSDLRQWIENLSIFEKIGRVSYMITRPGLPINYHRDTGCSDEDFINKPHNEEFLWIKLSPDKKLNILDGDKKFEVNTEACFFDHHFWHGCEEASNEYLLSLKIEGIFKREVRNEVFENLITTWRK